MSLHNNAHVVHVSTDESLSSTFEEIDLIDGAVEEFEAAVQMLTERVEKIERRAAEYNSR